MCHSFFVLHLYCKSISKKRKEFAFHLYCKIPVSPEDYTRNCHHRFSPTKLPRRGEQAATAAVTLPFLQLKLGRRVSGDPPLSLLKRKKEAKKEKNPRFTCSTRFKYHPKITHYPQWRNKLTCHLLLAGNRRYIWLKIKNIFLYPFTRNSLNWIP